MLRYRMVMTILILIKKIEIKKSKVTRGHHFTLVKKQTSLMLESFHFPRGPEMYGIHYQHSVYMVVELIYSKIY